MHDDTPRGPEPPTARRRSTGERRRGLGRAAYLAHRLGTALRDRRRGLRLSQRQVGERAGLSQREISRLEAGQGSNAGIDTWAACGAAVGLQLAAFLEHAPGADRPQDFEHLRRQNLVIAAAAGGGWRAEPEAPLEDDGRYPRSIDVLLTRVATREAAVVEVWDLLTDGGAAMRGLDAKVRATRARLGHGWRVRGLLVIRGTQRNRGLVRELSALFAARCPASSRAWLRSFGDPAAEMPDADGLAWTDVEGTALVAARLTEGPRPPRGARVKAGSAPSAFGTLEPCRPPTSSTPSAFDPGSPSRCSRCSTR